MDIPPYREIIEVGLRWFIHNLFGKKDIQEKSDLKMQDKTSKEQAKEKAKPAAQTEKKPFWQSMKEIFKKKSK